MGESHSISLPVELLKDNILTHNHPSGCCAFSIDDIDQIIANNGYEIRTVTQDGRFVSFKKGEGDVTGNIVHDMRVAKLTHYGSISYATEKLIQRVGENTFYNMSTTERTIAMGPYIEEQVNSWMRINAHKYGYIFKEGRI